MSGYGRADGTSHGEMAIEREAGCSKRERISVIGHIRFSCLWRMHKHCNLLRGLY